MGRTNAGWNAKKGSTGKEPMLPVAFYLPPLDPVVEFTEPIALYQVSGAVAPFHPLADVQTGFIKTIGSVWVVNPHYLAGAGVAVVRDGDYVQKLLTFDEIVAAEPPPFGKNYRFGAAGCRLSSGQLPPLPGR